MLNTPCMADGKRHAQVEENFAVPNVIPEEINPPIYPVITISLGRTAKSVGVSLDRCLPSDSRDAFTILLGKIECKRVRVLGQIALQVLELMRLTEVVEPDKTISRYTFRVSPVLLTVPNPMRARCKAGIQTATRGQR